MVTITTEIQGKVTSVATMARSINSLLVTFDVFQQYPAGYLALKHDGYGKIDAGLTVFLHGYAESKVRHQMYLTNDETEQRPFPDCDPLADWDTSGECPNYSAAVTCDCRYCDSRK